MSLFLDIKKEQNVISFMIWIKQCDYDVEHGSIMSHNRIVKLLGQLHFIIVSDRQTKCSALINSSLPVFDI